MLRFDQINTFVGKLSRANEKIMSSMSSNMSLISGIATQVPQEIRNYIVDLVFGIACHHGSKVDWRTLAIEKFCKKSVIRALQRYRKIKNGFGNIGVPMDVLYVMSRTDRELIFKANNPWHYPYPFITKNIEEKIRVMDERVGMYIKGKEVMVMPNEAEKDCIQCLCMACTSSLLSGGILCGGGTVIGACSKYGAHCVCTKLMLDLICNISLCIGISIGTGMGCKCCYTNVKGSEKKVL
jgi:hypothetical protein